VTPGRHSRLTTSPYRREASAAAWKDPTFARTGLIFARASGKAFFEVRSVCQTAKPGGTRDLDLCQIGPGDVWQRFWQPVMRNVARVTTVHTFESTAMRSPKALTPDSLFAALDRIDVEGWDGPAGSQLLHHVLRYLVRPQVRARRLHGLAAVQAEATGWETAWEILRRPYLRTTENPLGVLWVAIRRAIRGEVVAARLATSPRHGWCWSPAGHPDDDPAELVARRVEEPLSLDLLIEYQFEVPAAPMLAPLGPALGAVVRAMVEEGWSYPMARRVVEAVAANAGLGRTRARTAGGWRTLSQATGLPPWQIRRLTVLLCGAPGWRGLIEVMAETGTDVLRHAEVRSAIRATLRRRLPPPQTHAIGSLSPGSHSEALLEAS
jgi:hypothetical protein